MNRDRSQIGYDAEELYFHQLDRERIERLKAQRETERARFKASGAEGEIPVMQDEDYQEAA